MRLKLADLRKILGCGHMRQLGNVEIIIPLSLRDFRDIISIVKNFKQNSVRKVIYDRMCMLLEKHKNCPNANTMHSVC